jgi:hypothetical protein
MSDDKLAGTLKASPLLTVCQASYRPVCIHRHRPRIPSSGAPVPNVRVAGNTTPTDLRGAIGQGQAVADTFAVKVNAGLGGDGDVGKVLIVRCGKFSIVCKPEW